MLSVVAEKKYTEDHEWIELSSDGKTGTLLPAPTPTSTLPFSLMYLQAP